MELLLEIKKRQSPRYFLNKLTSTGHLNLIFKATKWAPSMFNNPPWRYFVADKKNYYSFLWINFRLHG